MSNLQYRQQLIQEKRKQTSRKQFVMEICSRGPASIYRNQGLISRYPESGREGRIIYQKDHDVQTYKESGYDSSLSFFDQIQHLFLDSIKPCLTQFLENENSEFADGIYGCKDCYLVFSAGLECKRCAYSACIVSNLDNVYNSFSVINDCSNIYSSSIVTKSYNVFFSFNIHDSSDIRFSSNLIGCTHCLMCDNLQNQSYCIKNKQYSKEDYRVVSKKILEKKHLFGSYHTEVSKKGTNYQSEAAQGGAIVFSQDIKDGYAISRVKNAQNVFYVSGGEGISERIYDGIDVCMNNTDFYANAGSGVDANHFYCTVNSGIGTNVYYSFFLESCSFCLGCIGLKNKSYCILNKQYTKEERYVKVDEIFGQMEADGTLGQFFSATMNPFYFNDTAAYLINPSFTKEEVSSKGYLRRDEVIMVDIPSDADIIKVDDLGGFEGWVDVSSGVITRDPGVDGVLDSSALPQNEKVSIDGMQRSINQDILKKTIQDSDGNVYKIIKMEYDFLIKHGLPLPRKHRLERMRDSFKIEN